jgi:outer membrane protein TolC
LRATWPSLQPSPGRQDAAKYRGTRAGSPCHRSWARPLALCLITTLAAGLLAGCAPDDYRNWADLQVDKLLADREKQTIDYLPDSARPVGEPTTRPMKPAYERIPFTRIAPPGDSPMERRVVRPTFSPLGPDARLQTAPPVESDRSGMEILQQRLKTEARLGPPDPGEQAMSLDLFGSIAYAVRHSRAYQDTMDNLYLAALDVTLQRHLFEPSPFASSRLEYDGQGNPDPKVGYQSAMRVINTTGVNQKLPYGGTVTASVVHNFVETLTGSAVDGNSAQIALSGSVPLLRGFGMVNLEPLIQSERTLIYQVRTFDDYRRGFVVGVAQQYFQLVSAQQSVLNRRLNLLNLDELTERTRALYDNGRISFLEVQRALQSRLSAESSLINAEESYAAALDTFKILLGMPPTQALDVVPVVLDTQSPQMDTNEAIRLAEQYRLDLQTAMDKVEDARRAVKNAENGLLPDLNANANITAGDPVNYPTIGIDHRTTDYSTGVTLNLPLDKLAERNTYRKALIGVNQANRAVVSLHDTIVSNVRDSLRQIRAAEINLKIQQRGIDLAEKRLEYSNELLKQGKITARDIVEAQQSLLDAQDAYESARSSLETLMLSFMQTTGTLRVDPEAGAIGRAMDRKRAAAATNR